MGIGQTPPNNGGGVAEMQAMMNKMNAEATQRSMLNIQDQGTKETIQGINQAAKAGHDQAQEINRNLK